MGELLPTMQEWLIETLIQGAYIREYHIWEKDTKQYVNNQLGWNGEMAKSKWPSNYIPGLKTELARFSVQVPDQIMDRIIAVRDKVNINKHEPGLLDEHFVSRADYDEATKAIEGFWEELGRIETPAMLS
jgi:hypothetical protein